jgi:hypothetical protein
MLLCNKDVCGQTLLVRWGSLERQWPQSNQLGVTRRLARSMSEEAESAYSPLVKCCVIKLARCAKEEKGWESFLRRHGGQLFLEKTSLLMSPHYLSSAMGACSRLSRYRNRRSCIPPASWAMCSNNEKEEWSYFLDWGPVSAAGAGAGPLGFGPIQTRSGPVVCVLLGAHEAIPKALAGITFCWTVWADGFG